MWVPLIEIQNSVEKEKSDWRGPPGGLVWTSWVSGAFETSLWEWSGQQWHQAQQGGIRRGRIFAGGRFCPGPLGTSSGYGASCNEYWGSSGPCRRTETETKPWLSTPAPSLFLLRPATQGRPPARGAPPRG